MQENYFMISDAAKKVNVENHVLRYWEEELDLPIKRNEMGHRHYSKEDIEKFIRIKDLKNQGIQLKAIRSILEKTEKNGGKLPNNFLEELRSMEGFNSREASKNQSAEKRWEGAKTLAETKESLGKMESERVKTMEGQVILERTNTAEGYNQTKEDKISGELRASEEQGELTLKIANVSITQEVHKSPEEKENTDTYVVSEEQRASDVIKTVEKPNQSLEQSVAEPKKTAERQKVSGREKVSERKKTSEGKKTVVRQKSKSGIKSQEGAYAAEGLKILAEIKKPEEIMTNESQEQMDLAIAAKQLELVGGNVGDVEESRDNKAIRLQYLLKQMIGSAVRETGQELCDTVKESILKEMDYQFRLQEEREAGREAERRKKEDEHNRKLDELLRTKSKRKKHSIF